MEHTNIQYISNSYLCSNCGACAAICGKNAISFKWTSIGRMYAQVDFEKCINCSRCTKVCPSIVEPSSEEYSDLFIGNIKKLYVGQAIDEDIFKNAQSGGICTALISYLLDRKKIDCAVVCKMDAGNPIPDVKAVLITDVKDLINTQKSCYTPVEMLSILANIQDFKSVAFVGLPCHIEGLNNLQNNSKKYSNIKYKIGLICDRTLCRTIMNVFASYLNSDTIKIDWRRKYDKHLGYNYVNAPVVVYSSKDEIRIPNKHRFLMKEYFTPPRCYVCYDKLNIMSDITLGDPWRMPNVKLDKGASVIISRTEIGEELLNQAINDKIIKIVQHPIEEIITGQLINERRATVLLYSKMLKDIISVESHLLKNRIQREIKDNTILKFIKREEMSQNDIIKEAIFKIKESEKDLNIFLRLISRIKHIICKLLKNENSNIRD